MILMDETARSGLVPATYDPSLPMWTSRKRSTRSATVATYRRHAVIYAGSIRPSIVAGLGALVHDADLGHASMYWTCSTTSIASGTGKRRPPRVPLRSSHPQPVQDAGRRPAATAQADVAGSVRVERGLGEWGVGVNVAELARPPELGPRFGVRSGRWQGAGPSSEPG